MATDLPLHGKRILIFVGDIYEDLELWYPKLRLIEAGAEVVVAGAAAGKEYAGKNGYPCLSDAALADMRADDFDGLVVPGGFMPDKLRRDPHVLELVRGFAAAGKLVAAICHGGWIPISARVYQGVRVTGSPGIKDDLINAGAIWEDAPVVIDRHFVSSRKPDDLPDFCRGILQVFGKQPTPQGEQTSMLTIQTKQEKRDNQPRIMLLGHSLTSMVKAMTLQLDLDPQTCHKIADRLATGKFASSTITTACSDARNPKYTKPSNVPKLTDAERNIIAETIKATETTAR